MTRFSAILRILAFLAAAVAVVTRAEAQPGKILRYVSQRADRAYLREGPSYAHQVMWVYRHKGYPFAVLAEFDVWRRVQAPDGAVGWMSASMLSDQRTVLATGQGRVKIFASADGGKVVGLADPGAVAGLEACAPNACHIHGEGVDGWISRSRIWGVSADEVFDRLPR
ncbi:MAG TPA: SH3 domain-containing protein [Rhizomicrobium sp.]|nr:SH3 domain-containing protein [Rhizomicrobium sp.]